MGRRILWMVSLVCTSWAALPAAGQGMECTFDHLLARLSSSSNARDAALQDDRLYVADGWQLQVLDVSDPRHPELLGFHEGDRYLKRIDVSGDYAFCMASDDALLVFDVSDPFSPALVSEVVVGPFARDLVVAGDMVFTLWEFRGMSAFDISDPTAPVYMGGFGPPGTVDWLAVDNGLAIVTSHNGFWTVDVSDPTAVRELARVEMPDGTGCVAIDNGYAFVGSGTEALWVFDLVDPVAPVMVAQLPLVGNPTQIALEQQTAYVGMGSRGCSIIELADPTSPQEIGWYDPYGSVFGIAVQDGLAAFTTSGDLELCDLSTPHQVTPLVEADISPDSRSITVSGDLAFVGSRYEGVTVFDISDIDAPVAIGNYTSSNNSATAERIRIDGDRAYVAAVQGGLEVLDISDPTSPVLAGVVSTGWAKDVAVQDDTAFVAVGDSRLMIWDLVDLENSVRLASIRAEGRCLDLHGQFLYTGYYGLDVIDVSDPGAPLIVGGVSEGSQIQQIIYQEGYVYAASWYDGVLVYDVTDPTAPTLVAEFRPPFRLRGLDLQGDRLYACGDYGVDVFDISQPAAPVAIGSITPGPFIGAIDVQGDSACFIERHEYSSPSRFFIADVSGCDACLADFDNNGVVNTSDFIAFLNAWATQRTSDCSGGGCSADLDANGIVDTRDFVAFLGAWAAGC